MTRTNIKYSILEKDGEEYVMPVEHIPLAQDIEFSNESLESDNLQEAIVEITGKIGDIRVAISRFYNGTSGNNDWMGPSELGSNTPFIVVPDEFVLQDLSWSNQNSDVSFDLTFRKNSKTATIFHTYSVRNNSSTFGYENDIMETLPAGTALYIQYLDFGTNCSDMEITLWFKRA